MFHFVKLCFYCADLFLDLLKFLFFLNDGGIFYLLYTITFKYTAKRSDFPQEVCTTVKLQWCFKNSRHQAPPKGATALHKMTFLND
jgi:hypothetical protein